MLDPRVTEAIEFQKNFFPLSDESNRDKFGWVYELAEQTHKKCHENYNRLDDKATSIVTTLGSGLGLLAFGSLVAIGNDKASPWILLAGLPSFGFGIAAMMLANVSRITKYWSIPNAINAAEHVEKLSPDGFDAKAAFISMWAVTAAEFIPINRLKADYLDRSLKCLVAAIVFLAIPLVVGIVVKFSDVPRPAEPLKVVIQSP